jgi:hypothetical protein
MTTGALVNEVAIPAPAQKISAAIALRKPGSECKDLLPRTAAVTRLASAIKPNNLGVIIIEYLTTSPSDYHDGSAAISLVHVDT